MKTSYFRIFGQLATNNKVILVAVIDADLIGKNLPNQFDAQGVMMPKTIYTGVYPTIKINTDTIQPADEECKGMGIAGILTETQWYCQTKESRDSLGISI